MQAKSKCHGIFLAVLSSVLLKSAELKTCNYELQHDTETKCLTIAKTSGYWDLADEQMAPTLLKLYAHQIKSTIFELLVLHLLRKSF